jgi:hypothetical protein
MSEAKWKRISDKKYQRLVGEEWVSVDMPYGKVELIFDEFVGAGGIIDAATGLVMTDLPTLIKKFGSIGNIVLTEFDAAGEVKTPGNCRVLSPDEIPPLFEIAVDVIEVFTSAVSSLKGLSMETANQNADAPAKKAKKG